MSMRPRAIAHPILKMIKVNEIFTSIQGESTHTGRICTFIRLTGCNLSCTYCDTKYALHEGKKYTVDQLIKTVENSNISLVEITGGEPLLQDETPILCEKLINRKYTVLVETNGTMDISILPEGCIRIMDIKCPESGNTIPFYKNNLSYLRPKDECKMVISSRKDFNWALEFLYANQLHKICTVLFSPNTEKITPKTLAEWILEEKAPVRLGLQIHKIIWGKTVKGV